MILYFSGTGNTAFAVRLLADRLGDGQIVQIDSRMLRHPEQYVLEPEGGRVVWAFPTYSWGVPPVVVDFMRKVTLGDSAFSADHYMLTTCGDDMGYADRQWWKTMQGRNLTAKSAFALRMPNTYVCMKGFDVDSPDVERRKLREAPEAADRIADAILRGKGDILVRESFSWIKTYVVYPWFRRFAMSPRPFHASADCIGCGRCAASCPLSNIKMDGKTPVWGDRCALCLRCYHICTAHAVEYGRTTAGKGQYRTELKNVISSPTVPGGRAEE